MIPRCVRVRHKRQHLGQKECKSEAGDRFKARSTKVNNAPQSMLHLPPPTVPTCLRSMEREWTDSKEAIIASTTGTGVLTGECESQRDGVVHDQRWGAEGRGDYPTIRPFGRAPVLTGADLVSHRVQNTRQMHVREGDARRREGGARDRVSEVNGQMRYVGRERKREREEEWGAQWARKRAGDMQYRD